MCSYSDLGFSNRWVVFVHMHNLLFIITWQIFIFSQIWNSQQPWNNMLEIHWFEKNIYEYRWVRCCKQPWHSIYFMLRYRDTAILPTSNCPLRTCNVGGINYYSSIENCLGPLVLFFLKQKGKQHETPTLLYYYWRPVVVPVQLIPLFLLTKQSFRRTIWHQDNTVLSTPLSVHLTHLWEVIRWLQKRLL